MSNGHPYSLPTIPRPPLPQRRNDFVTNYTTFRIIASSLFMEFSLFTFPYCYLCTNDVSNQYPERPWRAAVDIFLLNTCIYHRGKKTVNT